MVEIYFDGACEPVNPGGTASYGYLVKQGGKTIIQGSKIIGTGKGMTNNIAEYTGLIEAVKAISNLNIKEKVRICGDSNIVCNVVAQIIRNANIPKILTNNQNLALKCKTIIKKCLGCRCRPSNSSGRDPELVEGSGIEQLLGCPTANTANTASFN